MERNLEIHAKRFCQDQLNQWHRLINPILFAYREIPQESTGFSLFQLYRLSVRGPGTILKELWTKEVNIPEVKTSYEYVTELRERGGFIEAGTGRTTEVSETLQKTL